MSKKRILLTHPLYHLASGRYADKFELKTLDLNAFQTSENPQQYLLNEVNEFKPHALYFIGFMMKFTHAKNTPKPIVNDHFFNNLVYKDLKLISNNGAGYDQVDARAAKKHSVIVTNTPDVVSDCTADLTLHLILSCARRSTEFEQRLRNGEWQGSKAIFGIDLKNKVLGIVGMGSIGKEVAKRALPFGMKIIYHQRSKSKEFPDDYYRASLDELLHESDFVSLHVPLNENTKHLINKNNLCKMKKDSYLINTSRGPVVNESDLVDALKEGKTLSGAGLDVFEFEPNVHKELLNIPNVTLLPHIGTQTIDTRRSMEKLCWDNIENVIEEESKGLTVVNEQK
ncbi:glyoxylate reductase [Acrasis kona]|uniref:Glyoxylate reductase n=1 Tax=Acrasis kona TaxID=1008807 RepID=A0AAW2Z5J8_9EUKA